MNFCAQCKYFVAHPYNESLHQCAHPKTRKPEMLNRVTGKTFSPIGFCDLERQYNGPCGQDGRLWEALQ